MKDFKSFSDGDKSKNNSGAGQSADFSNDKNVNMIKNIAASMKGKSQNEILAAIIAEAEKGKRAGTLTNEELDNFYNLMAPTLDGFKRQRLKKIIATLKKI